jgi:hypothetical protein
MAVAVKVHAPGLLNYAKAGKVAVTRIKKVMRKVLNVGRTEARRRITAEFTPRTGFLRRQARKMQTKVSVRAAEIKGQVTPIPRLMNIFEGGATLAHGRGILRPRPVVGPGQKAMDAVASKELEQVLREVGK